MLTSSSTWPLDRLVPGCPQQKDTTQRQTHLSADPGAPLSFHQLAQDLLAVLDFSSRLVLRSVPGPVLMALSVLGSRAAYLPLCPVQPGALQWSPLTHILSLPLVADTTGIRAPAFCGLHSSCCTTGTQPPVL